MTEEELRQMGDKLEPGPVWILHTIGMREWLRPKMDMLPRYCSKQVARHFVSLRSKTRNQTITENHRMWSEAVEWVVDNLEGKWCAPFLDKFHFEHEVEAVQFKLKFG